MNLIALLATLISICIFYLTGLILTCPFSNTQKEPFYETFVNLVVGFLAITSVYAIYKTNGNTILSCGIAMAIIYTLINRKNLHFNYPIAQKNFIPLVILLVCSTALFFYYSLFASKTPFQYIPHFDDVFYTFLSSKLGEYGIETANSVYDGNPHNATAYHYIELWFLNLLATLFNTNPIFSYSIIERSIGTTLLISGMMSITRHLSNKSILLFLSIFSVTICPFLLDYSIIEQKQSLAYRPLGMFMYCFYIWAILLYMKHNQQWFIPLLFAPLFHLGAMPTIYSSLVLLGLAQLIFDKKKKTVLMLMTTTFSAAIIILLFYTICNKSTDINSQPGFINYCLQFYSFNEFGKHLYANITNYIMFTPFFIPIGILFFSSIIKKNNILKELILDYKELIVFFFISSCCGLLYGYFSYPLFRYDADQLHTLVNIPLLCIFSYLAILLTLTTVAKNYMQKSIIFYLGCCLLYTSIIFYISRRNISYTPSDNHDINYITNVSDYYNSNCINKKGGIISSKTQIFNLEVPNGYAFEPFCLNTNFMYFTNLNTFFQNDSCINKEIEKTYGKSKLTLFFKRTYKSQLQQDPFSQFCQNYIQKHGATSIDTLQLTFIKKYHLGFLIVEPNTSLPKTIEHIIDTTFFDCKTKETFIFLKN